MRNYTGGGKENEKLYGRIEDEKLDGGGGDSWNPVLEFLNNLWGPGTK